MRIGKVPTGRSVRSASEDLCAQIYSIGFFSGQEGTRKIDLPNPDAF